VSKDPIGLLGGWNLQGYVDNPVNWIDPLGLQEIPNPNGVVPGGPWQPATGRRPGSFDGPRQIKGPRPMCDWVPPGGKDGRLTNPEGYWKTQSPGQKGWTRWNTSGQPITPEQAHPAPPKTPVSAPAGLPWYTRFGVGLTLMLWPISTSKCADTYYSLANKNECSAKN
jgi:uncharacterized protein RhaS with RHS repeats